MRVLLGLKWVGKVRVYSGEYIVEMIFAKSLRVKEKTYINIRTYIGDR